ncbi:MAG: AMP-binding protein [Candidatus Nanopelagicales bacterium]
MGAADTLELTLPPGPAGLAALLPPLRAALAGTGPAVALLPTERSAAARRAMRLDAALPAGSAVLVATSGSTGDPAAVSQSAAALASAAAALASWRSARDPGAEPPRWLAALPLFSVGGLMSVVRSLAADQNPVAAPWLGGARPFRSADFVAVTAELPPGPGWAVSLVPAMLASLACDPAGLSALRRYRFVLVGGAPLPADLAGGLRAAGVVLIASYGMTETCGGVVFNGIAAPGVAVDVAAQGRLRIAGPMVAAGYRDGRSPECWDHSSTAGNRFLTSDIGTVDGGVVQVLGRCDDIVTVGGVNVSVAAVEALLQSLPAVLAAVVIATPDPTWDYRLNAFLVPAPGASAGLPESAAAAVGAALGPPATPRRWELRSSLPTLPGGKVDRPALRDAVP